MVVLDRRSINAAVNDGQSLLALRTGVWNPDNSRL
jgi:hypothetical protein